MTRGLGTARTGPRLRKLGVRSSVWAALLPFIWAANDARKRIRPSALIALSDTPWPDSAVQKGGYTLSSCPGCSEPPSLPNWIKG
jgi:hypothetical protein